MIFITGFDTGEIDHGEENGCHRIIKVCFEFELQVLLDRFGNSITHHFDHSGIVNKSADPVHTPQLIQYHTVAAHYIPGELDIGFAADAVPAPDTYVQISLGVQEHPRHPNELWCQGNGWLVR